MKPEDNFSNDALIKGYADIYNNGGFGYVKERERGILDIITGSGTLLDVGCGDGFWSDILAERFTVTGIDISPEGIKKAKERRPDIEFIEGDYLEDEIGGRIFDVVFMRSPSFLNVPTESKLFFDRLMQCLYNCYRELWYIKWSKPPYDRYLEGSYIHDPKKIEIVSANIAGIVGMKSEIIIKDNYFYAHLLV